MELRKKIPIIAAGAILAGIGVERMMDHESDSRSAIEEITSSVVLKAGNVIAQCNSVDVDNKGLLTTSFTFNEKPNEEVKTYGVLSNGYIVDDFVCSSVKQNADGVYAFSCNTNLGKMIDPSGLVLDIAHVTPDKKTIYGVNHLKFNNTDGDLKVQVVEELHYDIHKDQ